MDPVPLLDLEPQYATLKTEIDAAIRRVVDSQRFILGPEVEELEQEIARFVGVPHAIGCASGTDALILALAALALGPGAEDRHLKATDEAFLNSNAKPIHPMRLCKELRDVLDEDATVIGDGGDIVTFAARVNPIRIKVSPG